MPKVLHLPAVGRTLRGCSVMGYNDTNNVTLPWRKRMKPRHKHPWFEAVYYSKDVLRERKEERAPSS